MDLLDQLLQDLRGGSYDSCVSHAVELNQIGLQLLNKPNLDPNEIAQLNQLLRICNILYNRTDLDPLPIDDGLYDLLLEKYKQYDANFQVGSEVIEFKDSNTNTNDTFTEKFEVIQFVDELEQMEYKNDLMFLNNNHINANSLKQPALYFGTEAIKKRKHNTKHEHPLLVGTLDKTKFVMTKEAQDRGVDQDSNVKILERDFFANHIKQGIIEPEERFWIVMELKYDGISVEADCSNVLESARTRGDTGIGEAADITPLLEGYPFPHAPAGIGTSGLKFEAIMTIQDLMKFNELRGKNYRNCRSAIVGLFGAGDGYLYRDLITLIPLQTDPEESHLEDRIKEIEFLNRYYSSKGQPIRYATAYGTYQEILYQIHLFQQEAEFARSFLPFMYDGIVISYLDPEKRRRLGRENFINKYSVALKFTPLKRQTHFRGYQFTVGQDGCITPMIYYDAVEFYGTIHPKSSGHSYKRFMELGLREGDLIDVEYLNDVMPYVTKPDNEYNANNPNPIVPFVTHCPECGTPVVISDSGKSAYCKNIDCPGRAKARMVNMLDKLNLPDFGEAAINLIGKYSLHEIIDLDKETLLQKGFGPVESDNFIDRMNHLKTDPIYDYQIMGALGFTGVAIKTWKLILSKYTIQEIISLYENDEMESALVHIKGIGPVTVATIINEFVGFKDDIMMIASMPNVILSKGVTFGKQIRYTGFRDKRLSDQLCAMGYDAEDGSVTKSTDILLIPYEGYNSGSKLRKVGPNCQIVPVEDFIANMDRYL